MPERTLRVELLRHTDRPEELVALAAKLCYAGQDADALLERIERNDQRAFVSKVMAMGHESVLEHASFTFLIAGISRACLAQLTRHRIASFSVQSQRYVSYADGFGYVVPPSIRALGEAAVAEFAAQMEQMQAYYQGWQQRLGASGEAANQDARFALPNACETRLLLTMNARELRHFFSLRMCARAQWEIRALAEAMFGLCYREAPALFADAGPGCLRGPCPEGPKSCGAQAENRRKRAELLSPHQPET